MFLTGKYSNLFIKRFDKFKMNLTKNEIEKFFQI